MLDYSFLSAGVKIDQGKIVEWYVYIFGMPLIGSHWSGLHYLTQATKIYTTHISLLELNFAIGWTANDEMSDQIRKTKRLKLLAFLIGDPIEVEVPAKSPRVVNRLGVDYTIQEIKVKTGYKNLMPLFPYRTSIRYLVSSSINDVEELPFYKSEWEELKRRLTDNEIINGAINLKIISDEFRSSLR